MKEEITISFKDANLDKETLKSLRELTSKPYTSLKHDHDTEKPISLMVLDASKFWSGIDKLIFFINSLECDYTIFANGNSIGIEHLYEIQKQANNIKLEDIR